MKFSFFAIYIVIIFIICSCNESIDVTQTGCPLPRYFTDPPGIHEPISVHIEQKLSSDGVKLAFLLDEEVILEILNLKTGKIQKIDFYKKLPSNVRFIAYSDYDWCPYNGNRLLISAVTLTDTAGDGKKYVWGINLYVISLDGTELKKITPKECPKEGAQGIASLVWLHESTNERDLISGSFYTIYSNHPLDYIYEGIYIPQTNEFISPSPYKLLRRQAKDGSYYSHEYYQTSPSYKYNILINGQIINFAENNDSVTVGYVSWSPDSKKLALSVGISENDSVPLDNHRFSEIWIIDVEKYMIEKPLFIPVQIINLRKIFCMYGGMWAEFITDSTLAVSMGGPNADFLYIYEITTDGKMVRQLTFEP
ncbi:MAG: hypothetical protein EPN82_03320 [Bacteroidetes bacterium]|nr:MAG: hypothetical protein EPN82_03320 [Bacteroidota bacterium]